MNVLLGKTLVTLSDADLLGEGGEARVYRYQQQALKVFHQVTKQKAKKLARFPQVNSDRVIAPQELLRDAQGQKVLGYAMRAIQGSDFGQLASPRRTLRNSQVGALFLDLKDTLERLHAQQVIVGDLNDGNVLAVGPQAFLIDADSMQFDGAPCTVGHERFLDPRLYGVDLTVGTHFTTSTDWYAFTVMLFASLMCVHPFGGIHASLKTLLRRAEARHSVLRSDVKLPRQAKPLQALPDDALHWFSEVFERDLRALPPPAVLQIQWHTCTCGTEHARALCPECHAHGPIVARTLIRTRGRCSARTVFRTPGRIVCASIDHGLKYAWEEAGTLRREDGSEVRVPSGATRVGISGNSTWVADARGQVHCAHASGKTERFQTGTRNGVPVLAASARGVFVQRQEWLVDALTQERIGQCLENQTWLFTSDRLAVGFYRAGLLTHVFVHTLGRAGLRKVSGIHWEGKLMDATVAFDAGQALLSVVVELSGREGVHRWLIDSAGAVVASTAGSPRGNAALMNGRVLLATDAGLLLLRNDSGVLVEQSRFPDTQEFVGTGDELLPHPDGSLYVVGPREITQLTLS